ncbi:MAG: tetratricopeptide repeat protein [Magnetococcales bacterium]|nr:tetratricopeptide repeat protein [Magnetococcales bacterium]
MLPINHNDASLKKELGDVIELQKNGQNEEAILRLQSLSSQFPGHSKPYFLLGISHYHLKEFDQATDQISRAIAINPNAAEYHTSLGVVFSASGKKKLAELRWRAAIRLKPEQPEAYFHLGDAHIDRGQAQKAIDWLKQAVALKPTFLEAWNNLGLCYKALKQPAQAKNCFEKTIKLDPDFINGHVNLAVTHLITGDYINGWQEYLWRFKLQESPIAFSAPEGVPLWRGEPLAGKHLLLLSEQGFGDTLQFVRYLPILKTLCQQITLISPKLLLPLLERMTEIDRLESQDQSLGTIDYYLPLMTIPHVLKTTLESIPTQTPYLSCDPEQIQAWSDRLPEVPLRIGLVWEGKPLFQNDPLRRRSVTLESLAPLAANDRKILFVSLQKGEPARQIEHAPEPMNILNLDSHINNFADTAAIIENLDLVITIDTATAHLCGALAKKVWILLPYAPDWRWGLESDRTPWYPSAKLFRQQTPNQWQEPIEQMAAQLKEWPIT